MRRVWESADVCLLASRLEGFSIAMAEAMAVGCVPVVSRVSSGVNDILCEGDNGFTFPIGDVEAAVRCIASLAAFPERWRAMSQRAWQSVAQALSPTAFAERFASLASDARDEAPRKWPAARAHHMPPATEASGAIPMAGASRRYERIIRFIQSRSDAHRVVVYGLGVNGVTLLERLRRDVQIRDWQIHAADDHAHDSIFTAIGVSQFDQACADGWPADAIAIITPNRPEPLVARMAARGAALGHDFVCLVESIGQRQDPLTGRSRCRVAR